jgi:hypothetical protein
MDLLLRGDSVRWSEEILRLIVETAGRQYIPKLYQQGNIDFQVTRGLLGISL